MLVSCGDCGEVEPLMVAQMYYVSTSGCPNVSRLHLLWWQQQRWNICDCQAGLLWAWHRQRCVVEICDVGGIFFIPCPPFLFRRFVYYMTAKKRQNLKCPLTPDCIWFGNAIHLISFGLKSIASVMTRESTGSEWGGRLYSYTGRGRSSVTCPTCVIYPSVYMTWVYRCIHTRI